MTNQEAIEVMFNEWKCIDRNDGIHCDRKCESCDLVMDVGIIREAFNMAISALQEKDSLIARLKAEAIKRNVQYMKSGDRYLIGFVDGMRLARSIVDGSIDEPKYVYPSEGTSDDESGSD